MRRLKSVAVLLSSWFLVVVQVSAQNLPSVKETGPAKVDTCCWIDNDRGLAVVNTDTLGIPFFVSPQTEDNTLVLESKGVGIGTSNPNSTLHIEGDAGTTRLKIKENATGAGVSLLMKLQTAEQRPRFSVTHGGVGATWNFDVLNVTGNFAFIRGGGGPTFTFDSENGDLLIEGHFISDGAALNVPDFVFDEDYDLMPLDDVRAFIDAKSHLPEIPSANEVQAEGLNITDMQLKLLQKIEELTLYTLEQHDTITEQRQIIEALQASVEALQQDVADLRGDVR